MGTAREALHKGFLLRRHDFRCRFVVPGRREERSIFQIEEENLQAWLIPETLRAMDSIGAGTASNADTHARVMGRLLIFIR